MRNRDALDRLAVDDLWKPREKPDGYERFALAALAAGALVLMVTMAVELTAHQSFDAEAMETRIWLVAEENLSNMGNPGGTCPL